MNVPHIALYQNCINSYALPNKMAAGTKNRLSKKRCEMTSPDCGSKFKTISHEYPHNALYQNCFNWYAPSNKMVARAKNLIVYEKSLNDI